MKRLRHFCAATILTFTFTLAAFAGDMQCGSVAPLSEQTASVTGDTVAGDSTASETTSVETAYIDPLTGLAVHILQNLLLLL